MSRVSLQQEAMSTPERAKGKTSGTKPALPGLRDVEGGCVSEWNCRMKPCQHPSESGQEWLQEAGKHPDVPFLPPSALLS